MQKSIFAASVAAVLCAGGAQAADLSHVSMKDAPVYAPVNSWTGFYIGAGGGLGATNQDLKASEAWNKPVLVLESAQLSNNKPANGKSAELNGVGGEGGFATIQVGYDRQLDQHFVAGVFFDYDFADIGSKATFTNFGKTKSISSTLTDSWTAGGRLGYLVNANTLVYALGGYTQAHFDMPFKLNGDFDGWTLGAGIETALGGSWFLKGEYRYTDLDEKTLHSFTSKSGYYSSKLTDQADVQSGRLVLSYKLSGLGGDSLK
jgi:outer membrane immunogenic protein